MQSVHFISVQEMLDFLPDEQRLLTEHLRNQVLETVSDVSEKLSFDVPFFRKHRALCFIWPGAVP